MTGTEFLLSALSNVVANVASPYILSALDKLWTKRPDLKQRIEKPSSGADLAGALAEAGGVLEALAGTGEIKVDGSLITALKAARFDHQHGRIHLQNTVVQAPVLITGGTGTGVTTIGGNTHLRGAGTGIVVGSGAGIVITGNAGIVQT